LGDEWVNSETFPTRIEVDRRAILVTNGTLAGWFRTISRARRSADFAAARFRALSDSTTNTGLAEMLSLSGFTYLRFAENWGSRGLRRGRGCGRRGHTSADYLRVPHPALLDDGARKQRHLQRQQPSQALRGGRKGRGQRPPLPQRSGCPSSVRTGGRH